MTPLLAYIKLRFPPLQAFGTAPRSIVLRLPAPTADQKLTNHHEPTSVLCKSNNELLENGIMTSISLLSKDGATLVM